MPDPILSMIIPCYNHGRYLRDAVHSILGGDTSLGYFEGQTIKDKMEVIVVDDASSDDTPSVMQDLLQNFKNLKYHRMPSNSGTPSANNAGIRLATAPFLTVMSADDMREPSSLETMLNAAQFNTHSFVYDDTVIFTGGTRQLREDGIVRIWRMEDYDFEKLLDHNQMHTGIIFPKQAFLDTGGYPEVMRNGREDWAFHVALGIKGYCGIHIYQGGYLYRREGQNRTLTNQSSEWQKHFADQMHRLFSDIYKGRRPMGCCGGRGANRQQIASKGLNMTVQDDPLPGSKGMTLLRFNGTSYGKRTFFGPQTGARYSVSANKNKVYVDNLDLAFMTSITEDGRYLFSAESQQPQSQKPVAETVAKPDFTPESLMASLEQPQSSEPVISSGAVEPITDGSDKSINTLPGLGQTAMDKLSEAGISTLKDFLQKTPEELAEITGWRLSRAILFRATAQGFLNESSS